jgi:hypothetical protein
MFHELQRARETGGMILAANYAGVPSSGAPVSCLVKITCFETAGPSNGRTRLPAREAGP